MFVAGATRRSRLMDFVTCGIVAWNLDGHPGEAKQKRRRLGFLQCGRNGVPENVAQVLHWLDQALPEPVLPFVEIVH